MKEILGTKKLKGHQNEMTMKFEIDIDPGAAAGAHAAAASAADIVFTTVFTVV